MNKVEQMIQLLDEAVPHVMERDSVSKEEAEGLCLDGIVLTYLKGEDDLDVLDVAIAFVVLGKMWPDLINIKVFHDIYHSEHYEEVGDDILGYSDGPCPQYNLPIGLAKKYLDLLYKPGDDDTETFLWKCLCLGCFPDSKFLRLSEEEKHNVFTEDVDWVRFDSLFEMSEEDVESAIHLESVNVETLEEDPEGGAEA